MSKKDNKGGESQQEVVVITHDGEGEGSLPTVVGSNDTWAEVYVDRYGGTSVGASVEYEYESEPVSVEADLEVCRAGDWVLLEAERISCLPGYWLGRGRARLGIWGLVLRDWWRETPREFKLAARSWLSNGGAAVLLGATVVSCGINMKLDKVGWSCLLMGSTVAAVGAHEGKKLHKEVIERRWLEELDLIASRINREEDLGLRPQNPNRFDWGSSGGLVIMCLMRYGISTSLISSFEGLSLQRFLVKVEGSGSPNGRLYQEASWPGLREIQDRAYELQMVLRAPSRPDVHATSQGIAIDVPLSPEKRKDALFIEYILGAERPIGGIQVPMGVDFDKRVVLWDITNPSTPHCLTSGTTGSGKSMRVKTGLLALALWYTRRDIEVTIYDPKRDYDPVLIAKLPIVVKHLTDIDDIRDDLKRKVKERDARQRVLGSYANIADMNRALVGENEKYRLPYIYIIADELTELCADEMINTFFSNLARLGRTAGIVIDANAQRPAADVINVQLRSNLIVRWVGKVASTYDSYIATGNEEDPRGFYLLGNGDCMYYDRTDNGRRIQGLLIRPSEVFTLPIEWNEVDEKAFHNHTLFALQGSYDKSSGRVVFPTEDSESMRTEGGFLVTESMMRDRGNGSAGGDNRGTPAGISTDVSGIDSTDSAAAKADYLYQVYMRWREAQMAAFSEKQPPVAITKFIGPTGRKFNERKAEITEAIRLYLKEWLCDERDLLKLEDEEIVKICYGIRVITVNDRPAHLPKILEISNLKREILAEIKNQDQKLKSIIQQSDEESPGDESEETNKSTDVNEVETSLPVAEVEEVEEVATEEVVDPFKKAMSDFDSFLNSMGPGSDLYE